MTYTAAVEFPFHEIRRFWRDRVAEMIRYLLLSRHGYGYSTVSDVEVDEDWPLGAGEIRFTRDVDGERCRLYLDGKRWVGEVIP